MGAPQAQLPPGLFCNMNMQPNLQNIQQHNPIGLNPTNGGNACPALHRNTPFCPGQILDSTTASGGASRGPTVLSRFNGASADLWPLSGRMNTLGRSPTRSLDRRQVQCPLVNGQWGSVSELDADAAILGH
ncbi:hypothetical protein LXA43DRAFT_1094365 [Ganoderma leucocontextum]|nr:hypothetical protein LXA43DRAFT_1094365 [Ganoderma leucocontextum]